MKSRQKGKKKGSSKERVFGCDLQEHLQLSGQDVPQVLRSCAEFVEEYGVVDGIYRLSGVSSNIQKLRQEFEAERKPELRKDVYLQDIHCVSSLCKAYFRELPDPLLTYRLYDKFAEAVAVQLEPERLVKILEVLRELPDPNYRTLEFLMRHLVHMASFSRQTNMHARNLAIVWAPNLLRSKDIEASGFNGTAAFMEVRVQSIVVEFILTHVEQLFGGASLPGGEMDGGWRSLPGARMLDGSEDHMPKSLPYHLPSILQAGDGPPQIRPYHTIIEITEQKRKGSLKVRKWRSIFNLGRSGHETKRKVVRGAEDQEDKSGTGALRSAKSMDSLSAAAGASDEPEGPVGPSSLQLPESSENEPAEAAEGDQEPEVEGPGSSTNSEPGTPRAGRSAIWAGGSSRAERCAGVHISDPYNVNLPSHITSILNVTPSILNTSSSILSVAPNIISNVALTRLTRGLECPALQPRPSPASEPGPGSSLGPGPPDEKLEASAAPGSLASPGLDDCLSQEVQDSFSFLEDSSSSEPEWVGAEDREETKAGATTDAFSPGEDEPGMGYLDELLGVGPQVEEFSVEPPLDDLSLEEAQFVLAPSCCSPDTASPGLDMEEESGEEVFLSAYDDLSPLVGPKTLSWEGPQSLEQALGGNTQALEQMVQEQPCEDGGGDKDQEAQPETTWEDWKGGEGGLENEARAGELCEEVEEAGGSQDPRISMEEGSGEEGKGEGSQCKNQQGEGSKLEVESVGIPGRQKDKDPEKESEPEKKEEAENGEPTQAEGAERDTEQVAQDPQEAQEIREVVHMQKMEGGPWDEAQGQKQGQDGDQDARGNEEASRDAGAAGGRDEKLREQESGDREAEKHLSPGGDPLQVGVLPAGTHVAPLEAEESTDGHIQTSEPDHQEELEPEGQLDPEGCLMCPCPLGSSSGGVGMRLASTLVQVQQVRSVPVVPPKPQFAKMPGNMCSKIHVAPANPSPRPGRLDGTPGERAWGARAARSSWRNGGSLSFDAAVALARDRQRTEAQGVRRTQTCTGDYNLTPKISPCSTVPAHSPRPLSCLELLAHGTEGSGPRNRLSLPSREVQPPDPLLHSQRRSYTFETQANAARGEGLD
ncbi:rho GTPase-activating protein 30 isoform X2 [Erinaceus europaeus]|uniref:Rho GTPase-activating protein 30 isoform X2 n=1 Tax=Erinaceus europaeus TaxID=9365 RepID=A0A1S3WUH5_ERIEU|nr:rho GTPase-activating protein 30 isoform X2 [Erinaceus europaeus]